MFLSIHQLEGIAKWVGGKALERVAQNVRLASNRVTTAGIRALYKNRNRANIPTLAQALEMGNQKCYGSSCSTTFIAGTGCEKETRDFATRRNHLVTGAEIKKFRNGETYVRICESVRGKKVVLVQDFSRGDVCEKLMETFLLIDAAKRASAKEVELVCPQLPYIDEGPGTGDYEVDFFKMVLNLFFDAAQLDMINVGGVEIDRGTSFLLLQDNVYSHSVAPFLYAQARRLSKDLNETSSPAIVQFNGSGYRQAGEAIMRLLSLQGVSVERGKQSFVRDPGTGIIRMELASENGVQGKTAYVFQSCNTGSVNTDFIEMLCMIYAARKKGAKEVVAVIPYLPYNRQERKAKPREAIAAKFVANALVRAGATQIVSLDLHAAATQGFVDIPFQHITAFKLIADTIRELIKRKLEWIRHRLVVGAADAGRLKSARWMGLEVFGPDADFVAVSKERPRAGEALALAIAGKYKGRSVILFDDMVDSGNTIIGAAKPLKNGGSKGVGVAMTHGVFSDIKIAWKNKDGSDNQDAKEEFEDIKAFLERHGKKLEDYVKLEEDGFTVNALVRFQASRYIDGIIVTDSMQIPQKNIIDQSKVFVIPTADLLAGVCARIIRGESLQDHEYEGAAKK